MKVRPSVEPTRDKCRVIKRKGHVMVIYENPKHKQRQGNQWRRSVMARATSTDLSHDKRAVVSLTYIYSIDRSTSERILAKTGISEDIHVKDLTEDQVNAIRNEVNGVKVGGDLRHKIQLNIRHLVETGCYRGVRHRRGLPVRGQRTKTNARARRGPVRTIANKRK